MVTGMSERRVVFSFGVAYDTPVLGYRVGDVFVWKVPAGLREYRVKEILFQPEASGNYDL